MARFPQSDQKTHRVSEVLLDDDSSMGNLMKRAAFLQQLDHLLTTHLDRELAGRFQVAAAHSQRLTLVTPSASWATLLKMQSPRLLEALHRAGFPDFHRIEIRIAPLPRSPEVRRRRRELTPAARQALEFMSRLKDET
jgi:hypothetical protein